MLTNAVAVHSECSQLFGSVAQSNVDGKDYMLAGQVSALSPGRDKPPLSALVPLLVVFRLPELTPSWNILLGHY